MIIKNKLVDSFEVSATIILYISIFLKILIWGNEQFFEGNEQLFFTIIFCTSLNAFKSLDLNWNFEFKIWVLVVAK